MSSRTCRETTLWLAEDPGALPPPPTSGREGQGVILCLMVSLLLLGGLVLVQGLRSVLPEPARIEGAFPLTAGAAILPSEQGRTGHP